MTDMIRPVRECWRCGVRIAHSQRSKDAVCRDCRSDLRRRMEISMEEVRRLRDTA